MNTYRKATYHLSSTSLLRVSMAAVLSVVLILSAAESVLVQAKPLYALGAYPNTSVVLGDNTTITPSATPTGTTSINVSTDTNFKGTFVADPSTGVVRVTNAHPAGTYTVTVTAFGSSPDSTTFTLTVTDGVACDSTPGFTGISSVAVGTGPTVLTVGDFDNDGNQDLAVPNLGSNTVSIRLGNGDGTFSGTTDVATGFLNVRSVAVGDFNGNGNQDLAVVNRNSDEITIHLGNGDGTFAAPTNFAAGDYSTLVRVGDFNNDGRQDLAVLDAANDSVSIYLGNGDGTFGSPTSVTGLVDNPYGLRIGDFDNDGNQDLAVGSNTAGGGVSIRLGEGDGTFTGTTDLSWSGVAQGIALGDFNNDGDQDLLIAGGATNSVSVRLGNGDGTFGSSIDVSVTGTGYSAVVADFDNDGNQDFAVTNHALSSVSIRLGDGAGGFSAIADVSSGGTTAYAIVEGDFNNDSKLDFAVSNYGSNTVGIFLGNLPLCYDGNGSDGGSAPVDGSSPYAPGATVTVLDNTGSLVKTGYTFAGWNTAADGSGTSYVPAATFNITSPTILYAQWTVVVAPGVAGGDGPGGVGVTDGSSALALWLRPDRGVYIDAGCSTAAANGQDVACWQDQSGNSQDVMGLASTRRPTYNTAVLNGMPVLAYVGGDGGDVLTRTFASFASGGNQPYTIFSAFNPSNTNLENLFAIGVPVLDQNIAYHPYWSGLNNGRALYHYGDDLSVAGTVSGWQFAAFRYTAGTGTNQYYYDRSSLAGSRQTSAALNLPVNPILSVGGYDNRTGINGSELTGSIGEMIIFSQALTDVERILVENYLSAKYNIAMSANDVYDGDDSGSGDFDLDMAGIGRYDGSSHTQAHSVGLIVVNRTFLGDNGDWLTFGHPTPANSKTTADLPTSGDWASAPNPMRWARHWYFDLTDANTNGGTVDIIFDFSEGGMGGQSPSGQASNYRLLKRSGTSGQFSDIATASAIVGDQVQFLGVDVTLLGSNFTIGTLDNTNSPLGNPPTAVTLTAFTAEWDGDEVVVTWETALEIDTVGFNLWRSTDGGAYEQVNASLIPAASPGGVMGGTYEYVDAGVTPGKMYTYKLEELEVGSARNWYGPVSTGGSSYTTVKMKAFAVGEPQWLPAAGLAVAAALGVALVKRRRRA